MLKYIRPIIKVSTSFCSTQQATKRGWGEWANSSLQQSCNSAATERHQINPLREADVSGRTHLCNRAATALQPSCNRASHQERPRWGGERQRRFKFVKWTVIISPLLGSPTLPVKPVKNTVKAVCWRTPRQYMQQLQQRCNRAATAARLISPLS